MNIAEQKTMPSLDSIVSDLERYGIAQNAVELMTYGFTVVSPSNLGVTNAWVERLRNAAVTAYEKRHGDSIDYRTSTITAAFDDPFFDEDDVFIEAATNPAKLALVRLLLGQGAVHRNNLLIFKGLTADAPADESAIFQNLPLHVDQVIEGIPMGTSPICHRLNCTWVCTDVVDEADGPTLVVPASHHYGHGVLPHDTNITNTPYPLVRLKAKAGSVAIWQGGTYHSSLPRTRQGLRIHLNENHTRPFVHGTNASSYIPNSPRLSPELLDRHPELKRVLGLTRPDYDDIELREDGISRASDDPTTDPYA
jgi:hypothetical protein